MNHSGSSIPITASQWMLYSTDPTLNVLGGMSPGGEHYNQPYIAGSTPAYATSGNWLIISRRS